MSKTLRVALLLALTILPAGLAMLTSRRAGAAGAEPIVVRCGLQVVVPTLAEDNNTASPCTSIWTAVASTGAVDESALSIYQVNQAKLLYKASSTSTAAIAARYNVTNIPSSNLGLFLGTTLTEQVAGPVGPVGSNLNQPGWNTLELGYFDNAKGSEVSAQLHQVDICTGELTPLCKATSEDSPESTCVTCQLDNDTIIDFSKYLYFVNVTVSRNNKALKPSANTLRLYCTPEEVQCPGYYISGCEFISDGCGGGILCGESCANN